MNEILVAVKELSEEIERIKERLEKLENWYFALHRGFSDLYEDLFNLMVELEKKFRLNLVHVVEFTEEEVANKLKMEKFEE